jgi:hypothetical protein
VALEIETVDKCRLTIDLHAGTLHPITCPVVEITPGEQHYRDAFGAYARVDAASPYSGERFVVTGLHDDLGEAAAAAAAELRRRAEQLVALAQQCEQIEESTHA